MAAITDLAAASSVAATDLLVVSQSGTDRKVTADKFVTTDGAGKTAAVRQVVPTMLSLANNATQVLAASIFGLLMLEHAQSGAQGLIWMVGGANAVASISLRGGVSIVKNTAGAINVYYEAGQGYTIQNNTGSTATIYYVVLGV
jgi:hypothetical protein